jgi:GT2 family glycosyltransferase
MLDPYHHRKNQFNPKPSKSNLLFGTTSCMLISRQVYDAGLLFSTDFPEAAGEDIDYCLRAILGLRVQSLDFHQH